MINKIIAIGFCIVALCNSSFLFSQTDIPVTDTTAVDSTDDHHYHDYAKNAKVEFFKGEAFGNFQLLDTTLQDFEKFNPARKYFQDTYLTNAGAAIQKKYFTYDRNTGFTLGREQYAPYQFNIDSLAYYRTNTPYTGIFYVTGSHAEQLLHVRHSQNFGPQFNATLDYEKMKSDGFYTNDLKSHENLAITSWYETKNRIYHVEGAFLYGNIKNSENGGLTSDFIFQEQGQFPLASVARSAAITRWKNFRGQLSQSFALAKKIEYPLNDSVTAHYFAPYLEISHTFGIGDFDYLFEDPSDDTSYYGAIYQDMDTLRDISDLDGFYNKVSIGNPLFRYISADSVTANNFIWNIYLLQQRHELADQDSNYIYKNMIAGAGMHHNIPQTIFSYNAQASADIVNNAYYIKAGVQINNRYISPSLQYERSVLQPTVIQTHYYGFNSRWNNNFENIKVQKITASLASEKIAMRIDLNFYRLKDYIYNVTDTANNIFPVQNKDGFNILQLVIEKNFHLGDFHLENRLAFQITDSSIINIPEIIAAHSWYYETNLFKSALKMRTGIDVFYNSVYNLYNYDIVTGLFGLQNNTSSVFYPYADIYASFDIRTFRFFLKLENSAQGLYYDGYYEAVHYPMQNRSFKLGVSWDLFY